MRILLLGGTDLTLSVAERLRTLDLEIGGVWYVGREFDISYADAPVENVRMADIEGWCAQHGVPARRFEDMPALASMVAEGAYDVGLAAGWYHLIPRAVRELFRFGVLGVHASLLPRFRGGAPLNWALLAGEEETGVTLFELGDGIDDGPVYGQRRFSIGPRATIGELVAHAEEATLELVSEVFPALADETIDPWPQSGTASYCLQRDPTDGHIDWRESAVDIDRLVRAVGRPYPGARAELDTREVRMWAASPLAEGPTVHGAPGQIARLPGVDEPCVVTGNGVLVLHDVTDPKGRSLLDELRGAANRRFTRSR